MGHQIRAHLHHIKHPTVCDGKYTRAEDFMTDKLWCPRNFLHRCRVTFKDFQDHVHESTEPLPQDLRTALLCLTPRDFPSKEAVEEWHGSQPVRPWDQYRRLVAQGALE